MFAQQVCTEIVSIIEAVVLGSDGACIDIGMMSILGGIGLFVAGVVTLRFAGSWLLRRLFGVGRQAPDTGARDATASPSDRLEPQPYESPIRSTGAWGRKAR